MNKYTTKKCCYCGDLATQRDHFHCRAAGNASNRLFLSGNTVPSCAECNRNLGDFPYSRMAKRAAFIINIYENKYRSIIEAPAWSKQDFDELGPNMKGVVMSMYQQQQFVNKRMKYLQQCVIDDLPPVLISLKSSGFAINDFTCKNCEAEVPMDRQGNHFAFDVKGSEVSLGKCLRLLDIDVEYAVF